MKQLKIDSVRKYFSSSPIILLLVLLLLSSIGALFYFFTPASRIQSNPLLKVGNETLYTEDAHYKKTKIPTLSDEKVRDMIIQESIILQSGEKRGYVVLDSSVFDHTFKDMTRREALLDEVKKKYEASREETVSGTVVTVWFSHPGVASTEYAQRKTKAYDIIKPYYDAVANHTMSLEEAAEKLRMNKELAVLDPAYETNTSFSFRDKPVTVQIVSDTEFDQRLKELPLQTLSDLSIGRVALGNGTMVEAVYMFGLLTDRKQIKPMAFEDWIASDQSSYPVELYINSRYE